MKTRITLLIASLAFVISNSFSSTAHAEIDRGKLLGYWTGDLVVFIHGHAKGMQIEMHFEKNGNFAIKQLENGKVDKAKFKIEGDKILITDGQGKNTYFIDVELTDEKLRARFETPPESAEQNLSIELALNRGKAENQPKKDAKKGADSKK